MGSPKRPKRPAVYPGSSSAGHSAPRPRSTPGSRRPPVYPGNAYVSFSPGPRPAVPGAENPSPFMTPQNVQVLAAGGDLSFDSSPDVTHFSFDSSDDDDAPVVRRVLGEVASPIGSEFGTPQYQSTPRTFLSPEEQQNQIEGWQHRTPPEPIIDPLHMSFTTPPPYRNPVRSRSPRKSPSPRKKGIKKKMKGCFPRRKKK